MSETNERKLKEILTEAIDLQGLSTERLSQLTEIPERYLVALRDGDYAKLPAAPYVRGYLMKIGGVLNVDGRSLWEIYKNQNPAVKISGINDKLPSNRFAIKGISKKWIVVGIIAVIAIIYLGWRGSDFFGSPKLDITNPPSDNFIVHAATIILSGNVNPQDKLTINNEEVSVPASGRFEKNFPLQSGSNSIEFKVKRFLGKEIKIVRLVVYQP